MCEYIFIHFFNAKTKKLVFFSYPFISQFFSIHFLYIHYRNIAQLDNLLVVLEILVAHRVLLDNIKINYKVQNVRNVQVVNSIRQQLLFQLNLVVQIVM